MLPRRLHRSAGPRRPADWPPPSGRPAQKPAEPRPATPVLLVLLLLVSLGGASAAQPRLLGCWVASVDQLLPRAAISALAGAAGCAELCSQQQALLAAVSAHSCFCLDQPTSAAELTASCSAEVPPELQLLQVYSLTESAATAGDGSLSDSSHESLSDSSHGSLTDSSGPRSSLSSPMVVGTFQLEFVRCVLPSSSNDGLPMWVDNCLHSCDAEFSGGFVAMGPATGVYEYECHCSADDDFGFSLDDDICDQHCARPGQELDTTCGGETAGGDTALSVYRLVEDSPGSTPTPTTTRRSTGHSPAVSGFTGSACPDGGVQVDEGSCYRPEAVFGDPFKPDDPLSYQEAIDTCTNIQPDSGWRPWAMETKEERDRVYQVLLVDMDFLQDTDDVVTSGTVEADGSTVVWSGWPGDTPADWLKGLTTGNPKPGSVLIWGNIQGANADVTTLKYYKPTDLPKMLAVICELPTAGTTTVTTPESTTSSPSTTALPSSTPEPTPGPSSPDDVINDLIDDLNKTSASNITDTEVIDTVEMLDDILDAQMNMSSNLLPEERLDSDTQFTLDFVQLVDTLLSATDAWINMTQSQSEQTSSKLMSSTEAAGFLLANSTAVAGSDDVIEAVRPSLVLSASSVHRNYSGDFRFPSDKEAVSWIRLPEGYSRQTEELEEARLPQVGVLYRSETMTLFLSAANNSMADAEKRLNSPVLSFSLGGVGRRVQLPGKGAQMQLQYALTEREPPQRDVWRHLHAGEEPSAVRGSAVCAYWNDTLSEWGTDGCRFEKDASSKHHASCVCSHLTSFAILMDYHDYVGTPRSLDILTWVLGSLSLVGLVTTWILFTFNRSLHCTRTTITRNLCATYTVGLVLLLTVMDRRLIYLEPVPCSAVGMAIHYCFLSVFAWTMVEGIHLYKVLRHVFEPKSNSMTRYYMYGYLLPALIIIATNAAALAVDQYAYVRDEFCWLTIPYFIWFYNGPIGIVLIMNLFVIILAFRSAATLKVNQLRAKKEKMKRWLKGWFSLSCLLGLQWAVGYIYVDGSNVFDYVFTALNCSQGLLIFIFHCVLRERTRQILLGRFSTAKRSTMMNSVYGQMVIAERKKQEYRQSRMSHDTCVTQLSNTASPANSESPDSSPASERSSSSSQGSSSSRSSVRAGSRNGRQPVTRGISSESHTTSSLRGRVNPAFQPDEPWAPLPDISEEADGAASPRYERRPTQPRGFRAGHAPPGQHTDGAEMYRSNSVAALRHGRAY